VLGAAVNRNDQAARRGQAAGITSGSPTLDALRVGRMRLLGHFRLDRKGDS